MNQKIEKITIIILILFFLIFFPLYSFALTPSTVQDYLKQNNYKLPTVFNLYLKSLDEGGLNEAEIQFLELLVKLSPDRQRKYGMVVHNKKEITAAILKQINEELTVEKFIGYWVNEEEDTNAITKIDIKEKKGLLEVHMWGKCHPTDCDWGFKTIDLADAKDAIFDLNWELGISVHTQKLFLISNTRLKLEGACDGRLHYEYKEYFVKEN